MPITMFDSRNHFYKKPFGAVPAGTDVGFTVCLPKHLCFKQPELHVFPFDTPDHPTTLPMHFKQADLHTNLYTCTFKPSQPALLGYSFTAYSQDGSVALWRQPDHTAGTDTQGSFWQLTVYDPSMQRPACLGDGILYQIFPDRFRNSGKPKFGVPTDRILRSDWGGMPIWQPNEKGEITNSDYFGGDLAGITEKLDYLQALGVTALYLNPIFEAHSNHRYDTADYKKIDPLLGTQEDFETLCKQARKRGIDVILDGVFNHTGSDSVYFNRKRRYGDGGAYNDPHSPYRSWYRFTNYPEEYESWWGFSTLPNVDEANPDFIDFICGQDGVLQHWIKLGASGFRLDVVDELPDVFLDRLNQAIKSLNPEAVIIGEVWEDASNKESYGSRRRYLLGGQLDSVMNYPFKNAILSYVKSGNGQAFLETILQILENYPRPVIESLMNPLSTHDTERAITVLAAPPADPLQSRAWQAAHHFLPIENYEKGRVFFLLACILQFGLPGIPCVYYGDEAGLSGYRDPFNRFCYPWGQEDQGLIESMQTLGQIRKTYPLLQTGDFLPILVDDTLCCFLREKANNAILFVINRGNESRTFPLPPSWRANSVLFSTGKLEWECQTLGACSGAVILLQSN